jgi:hypothetical protein
VDTYRETHEIILTKDSERALRDNVIEKQLVAQISSVNNKSLAVRGWLLARGANSYEPLAQAWSVAPYEGDDANAKYTFSLHMTLSYTRDDGRMPETHELGAILRTLAVRARQPSFGLWALTYVDGKPYQPSDEDEELDTSDLVGYADVTLPDDEDWAEGFAHLFGLTPHITRVRAALEAGLDSGWANRFHCALVGPPGCGKSDIGESLRRLLGEDAVMKLDATSTTAAGAIKELAEREILPRLIVIEEIEKAPEAAMSFLLGVLDQRSEIRKTTARGTIQRDTKLFAIATVNDVALFRKLQAGALSSRFPNLIFFKRPPREVLAQILTREVQKVHGDYEWIAPTLDYCADRDITDPRKVISLCLCGRDAWLDGSYASMLDATGEPESE